MSFDCIEHTTRGNRKGYGSARFEGQSRLAHRVAYCKHHNLSYKDIEGQVVRHKCDNPRCINPLHLELGTQADNVRDMQERNRIAKGERHGMSLHDDNKVKLVLSMRNSGMTQRAIAAEVGMSQANVCKILNGLIRRI